MKIYRIRWIWGTGGFEVQSIDVVKETARTYKIDRCEAGCYRTVIQKGDSEWAGDVGSAIDLALKARTSLVRELNAKICKKLNEISLIDKLKREATR